MNGTLERCFEGYMSRQVEETREIDFTIVKAMTNLLAQEGKIDITTLRNAEDLINNYQAFIESSVEITRKNWPLALKHTETYKERFMEDVQELAIDAVEYMFKKFGKTWTNREALRTKLYFRKIILLENAFNVWKEQQKKLKAASDKTGIELDV